MGDIGSLIIKIKADAGSLEKSFHDLGQSGAKFGRAIGNIGSIVANGFVAATAAAVAMSLAAGRQAEELEQLAQITGINTDKLQEYEVMLNRAGLTGNDLATTMKQLSSNLEEARRGTGTAGDRFRQLGIDIRTVTSTDDLIQKIAQSQLRFADGTQKAAIMSDLLGKGWQTFMRAFAGGAKSFREVEEASKKLGLTMSTSNLATLAKMDTAVDDLQIAFKRFSQQLAVTLAPSIEFVTKLITQFMAFGSRAFHELNLMLDITGAKLTHFALKAQAIFENPMGLIFEEDWAKLSATLELIGREEDKLIAKLTAAHKASRALAQPDARPEPPAMIDSAKQLKADQSLLDAQLRAKEAGYARDQEMLRSVTAHKMAVLDQEKAFGIKTEMEVAQARMAALHESDEATTDSVHRELEEYSHYMDAKRALFAKDANGQAELLKFEEEATAKKLGLANKLAVQMNNSATAQIHAGLQVKTFWQRQLDDLVASNAFSISQITTAWTSGLANSIVNGGNFVKQAWQATQVAIIQGAINTTIQYLAQLAIRSTADKAAAAGSMATWGGAAKVAMGAFAAVAGGIKTMFATVLMPAIIAVGKFIMTVLTAIAVAMKKTIFGIPVGIAILAGVVIIGAALAAAGAIKFADGGIVTGPTNAMIGEGGSSEAVIPLNSRGAAFMQDAFGMGQGGNGQPIHTHVYLNGREIAEAVSDDLPGAWRRAGLPA